MTPTRFDLRPVPACASLVGAVMVVVVLAGCTLLADLVADHARVDADASVVRVLVRGARSTVVVAGVASGLSVLLGVVMGALAGLLGGMVDRALTRGAELVAAFPAVVMVALVRSMSPATGLLVTGAAIGALRCMEVARLVRVEVIAWRSSEFSVGAMAIGATAVGSLVHHVGPRLAPLVAQTMVSGVGAVVVIDMLVEFLGLGADGIDVSRSWGASLARAVSSGDGTTVAALLGASIMTVGAVQVLAERVRERLDPHGKRATPCGLRG